MTVCVTRVLFVFEKDCRVAFRRSGKSGEIGLIKDIDEFLKKRDLGPDALDVDLSELKKMLAKHRGAVKSVLMNQRLIAGIGNVYADEILFHARHSSGRAQAASRPEETKAAVPRDAPRAGKSIESQIDVDRMPRSWLLPHRGRGGKCPRCGRELQSSKIGGRTAWFWSHCQKRAP